MDELDNFVKNESIELIIWDLDGVIYDLDWYYQNSPKEFLIMLCNEIDRIDNTIIKDKLEFVSRLFPYPEINEVGSKYGKEVQLKLKSFYLEKEMKAVDRAIAHQDVIDFIKQTQKPQTIWSNNYSNTIEYLLKKAGIENKIQIISSLDNVILSKPNIEGFYLISKNFPLIKKENIVIVGDSIRSDKVAAENSGIKFFHYIQDQ